MSFQSTNNKLRNKRNNQLIAENVILANSFAQRSKGLLGKKSFEKENTLWIQRCQSIHTFFMKFPLDAVFVDKDLKVTNILFNLKPWRVTPYYFKAKSVFEFAAGTIDKDKITIGDQLYVGD